MLLGRDPSHSCQAAPSPLQASLWVGVEGQPDLPHPRVHSGPLRLNFLHPRPPTVGVTGSALCPNFSKFIQGKSGPCGGRVMKNVFLPLSWRP